MPSIRSCWLSSCYDGSCSSIAGSLGKYRTRFYQMSVSLCIEFISKKNYYKNFGTMRVLFQFGTIEIFVQIELSKKDNRRQALN